MENTWSAPAACRGVSSCSLSLASSGGPVDVPSCRYIQVSLAQMDRRVLGEGMRRRMSRQGQCSDSQSLRMPGACCQHANESAHSSRNAARVWSCLQTKCCPGISILVLLVCTMSRAPDSEKLSCQGNKCQGNTVMRFIDALKASQGTEGPLQSELMEGQIFARAASTALLPFCSTCISGWCAVRLQPRYVCSI